MLVGYCPICDKEIVLLEWEDNYCSCPECGHHVNVKEREENDT